MTGHRPRFAIREEPALLSPVLPKKIPPKPKKYEDDIPMQSDWME